MYRRDGISVYLLKDISIKNWGAGKLASQHIFLPLNHKQYDF